MMKHHHPHLLNLNGRDFLTLKISLLSEVQQDAIIKATTTTSTDINS